MTLTQQIITIGLCILGTMTTRFLPFIIFSENRKTPEFIQYIGKYLPYCLRNADVLHGTHGLPEAVSILITTLLHIWKRNMFLSIAAGTISYMLLLHFL